MKKVYWLRDNVLKSIFQDLINKEAISNNEPTYYESVVSGIFSNTVRRVNFSYVALKLLIAKYGKTNKQIAKEIIEFTSKHLLDNSLKDKIVNIDHNIFQPNYLELRKIVFLQFLRYSLFCKKQKEI